MTMTVMAIQFCKSSNLFSLTLPVQSTENVLPTWDFATLMAVFQPFSNALFLIEAAPEQVVLHPLHGLCSTCFCSYKVTLYVVSRKLRTRGSSLNGESCQLSEGGLPESNESGGGVGGGSLVNGEYVLPLEP